MAKLYHLEDLRVARERTIKRESGVRIKPLEQAQSGESTTIFGGERLSAYRSLRIEAQSGMLAMRQFRQNRRFQMRMLADFLSHGGTENNLYDPEALARKFDRLAFSGHLLELLDAMLAKAESKNDPAIYTQFDRVRKAAMNLFKSFFSKSNEDILADYSAMEDDLSDLARSLNMLHLLSSPEEAAERYLPKVDQELNSMNGINTNDDLA